MRNPLPAARVGVRRSGRTPTVLCPCLFVGRRLDASLFGRVEPQRQEHVCQPIVLPLASIPRFQIRVGFGICASSPTEY